MKPFHSPNPLVGTNWLIFFPIKYCKDPLGGCDSNTAMFVKNWGRKVDFARMKKNV